MPAKTPQDLIKFNENRPDTEKVYIKIIQGSKKIEAGYCDHNGNYLTAESYLTKKYHAGDVETKEPGAMGRIIYQSKEPSKIDFPWGKISMKDDKNYGECLNAYIIGSSSTAPGWGILLYELLIELSGDRGVTPDRFDVSSKAADVWIKFYERAKAGSDLEKQDLDPVDMLNPSSNRMTSITSDDCESGHIHNVDWNPDIADPKKAPKIIKAVNSVYKGSFGIQNALESLVWDSSKKAEQDLSHLFENLLKNLCKEAFFEAAFNAKLLKKMGYNYVGRNKRIGSDAFVHAKDDNNPSYHKKMQTAINKNLNKGGYYRSKKHDTLKDPPTVGISLPKKLKG